MAKEKVKEVELDEDTLKVILAYNDLMRSAQVLYSIFMGQMGVIKYGYDVKDQLRFDVDIKTKKLKITELDKPEGKITT